MRKITLIVVHCSATRCNQDYTVQQLFHDHVEVNHWRFIGYHYYIRRNGKLEETRPLERMGAHAKGHNAHSIGICYEGDLTNKDIMLTPELRHKKRRWQVLLCA